MKIKKGWLSLFLILVLFSMRVDMVNAASVQISADKSSVIVGNTITFTVTISGGGTIGQAYGNVSSTSNLSLQAGSSGTGINYYNGNNEDTKNLTYTYKYKATSSGVATLTVSGVEIGILETGSFETPGAVSKSVTVVEANSSSSSGNGSSGSKGGGTISEKKDYSSDNSLSSLSVDGYELIPQFSKEVLEYKLTRDEAQEKIRVVARANHEKASVVGAGEINLSSGENTIEIKVTAENGNEKIYKLLVLVKDLHPISVSIDKDKYTLVKKNNNLMDKLDNYEEVTIQIQDQDVVAYANAKTKVTLVILKDAKNKLAYYVYDASNNEYYRYHAITIHDVTLQLLDSKEKLSNYRKYQIQIQEEMVDIYKIKESHKVGLIYGMNVATGNTGYYVYDKNEETLSKYYDEEVKIYQKNEETLKDYLMFIMGGIASVVIIVIIISLGRGRKRRHTLK